MSGWGFNTTTKVNRWSCSRTWRLAPRVLSLLLFFPGAKAQQWSRDPEVDHMLQLESDLIKAQDVLYYCERDEHRQEKMCEGVNDGQPSKWMSYQDALSEGKKQLAKPQAPPAPSLGDAARQLKLRHQQLVARTEKVVDDYYSSHSAEPACMDKAYLVKCVVSRLEANTK